MTIANSQSGERSRRPARALFIFIGASPHTEWLDGQLATDERGFLLTGRDLQGDDLAEFDGERPLFLETSRPGHLRRRRRPLRLDQAGRLGGGRGLDGCSADPPAAGGVVGA